MNNGQAFLTRSGRRIFPPPKSAQTPHTHHGRGQVRARSSRLFPVLAVGVAILAASCSLHSSGGVGEEHRSSITPRQRPAERPAPPALESPTTPLALTLDEAVLLTLEHNRAFQIERLGPALRKTSEDIERAQFDPVVSAQLARGRERTERPADTGRTGVVTESNSGQLAIQETLPTGTGIELRATGSRTDSDASGINGTSRVGLSATQSLLRGFGLGPNLAGLRQARLDTQISEYELRGYAQALVAQVERTYWDFILAERRIRIYQDSLELAERQLAETDERIRVGKLADMERYAAQAEVALRREALINARSTLAKTRLTLLRLTNPPGESFWERPVVLETEPAPPEETLDEAADHVLVALRMRPELNQSLLQRKKGELEIVRTRNGLLPKLDLFLTLGKSGYADSFSSAMRDVTEGDSSDISGGARFEYPLVNRAAKARHLRAQISLRQAEEALENLQQLVEVDVRSAYLEVLRTREQVAATAATRKLQEESHRAEVEKFRVGKSTTLLVAQAQRDLVSSRIAEIDAMTSYLKSRIELYRLDGSLLERRGIEAPGREPVQEGE